MKKVILIIAIAISAATAANAQVGINTENPATTLHVVAARTDGSTAEGIIVPHLTLAELQSKDALYTAAQQGAMVYVSDETGTPAGKTVNITAKGYYFFDGAAWQKVLSSASGTDLTTASNGLTLNGNDVQLGGALTQNTEITGSNTLTISAPLQINSAGASPGANKVLTSDANGAATWQNPAIPTCYGVFSANGYNGTNLDYLSSNAGRVYYTTGSYIELPPGNWIVNLSLLAQIGNPAPLNDPAAIGLWITFADSPTATTKSADIGKGSNGALISGIVSSFRGQVILGNIFARNTSNAAKRYYVIVQKCTGWGNATGNPKPHIDRFASTAWAENFMYATPAN